MNQYVYLNKDIYYEDKIIKKNSIGIIDSILATTAMVTFVCINASIEVDTKLLKKFNPEKTGDLYKKKVCNMCNRLLDVNVFKKNQTGKNNRVVRRPSCNDCRNIIDGKNMTAKEKRRMESIKPYMEIWTCPICKKTTIPGLTSKVVCDHNHKTGHPRAWICDSCNTGLGRFKDNIELLESAIQYLKDKD